MAPACCCSDLQGYAFVVFACPEMVPHAISELDCRVVEGKILAVQRATEGKVSYGRESSTGGSDIGGMRDGGLQGAPAAAGAMAASAAAPGVGGGLHHHHPHGLRDGMGGPPHPLPHLPRHHHHRSSSTGSGLGLPPHIPPAELAAAAAGALGVCGGGAGHGPTMGHSRSHSGGGHGLSGLTSFTAAGPGSSGGSGSSAGGGSGGGPHVPSSGGGADAGSSNTAASAAAAAAAAAAGAAGNMTGGPRVPSGPPPMAGGSTHHSSGPSSTKQYDVNELYIGDLPLTWDEDAVRRLLGRFGRIKYFTLRNGRDK